jgi:CRISPR-associated protein Csy1
VRVGFLSHFFFNCTVGRYFASWITRLDPARFETIVYYTNEWMADDTRAIATAASRFRHLPGRSLHSIAREVAGDRLDVLVYPELGMHAETYTLASLRLASVQCAGWGHPDTPGHPSIDWFISCADMEPPEGPSHYSERLATLPGLGTHYARPSGEERATRADFGLPEERTLYLMPQSLFKIHPDNDERLAEVLARDANGLLVCFAAGQDALTERFAARLAGPFERRGLQVEDRVRFVVPGIAHGAYLALNRLCDVMLDTLHWSGGNTSLDALSAGLPVVTQRGRFMRGRQSGAMLEALGVPELVVADEAAWIETSVRLGRDRDFRMNVSERIAANAGVLFGRDEPVRALEDFLERAARGDG